MADLINDSGVEAGADPTTEQVPLKAFRDEKEKRPAAVTILKSTDDIYAFLRNVSNFPLFMQGVKDVRVVSPTVSHWTAEFESGKTTEWDSEIIAEKPGEMMAWQTLGESSYKQSGVIILERATGGRGTVVSMKIKEEKKFGQIADAFAKLTLKDVATRATVTLRRLKAYLETGEVPTVEGQPNGRDENDHH